MREGEHYEVMRKKAKRKKKNTLTHTHTQALGLDDGSCDPVPPPLLSPLLHQPPPAIASRVCVIVNASGTEFCLGAFVTSHPVPGNN